MSSRCHFGPLACAKDRCDALSSRLNLCSCCTPGSLQVLHLIVVKHGTISSPCTDNGPTLLAISCYFLLFLVISCYFLLFLVISCYFLLFLVISCYFLLFLVISCYFLLFLVSWCLYHWYLFLFLEATQTESTHPWPVIVCIGAESALQDPASKRPAQKMLRSAKYLRCKRGELPR